jgi:hypothetical protein
MPHLDLPRIDAPGISGLGVFTYSPQAKPAGSPVKVPPARSYHKEANIYRGTVLEKNRPYQGNFMEKRNRPEAYHGTIKPGIRVSEKISQIPGGECQDKSHCYL